MISDDGKRRHLLLGISVLHRFHTHIRPLLKLKYNHLPRIKIVKHGYHQNCLNPYFYPSTTLKLYRPLAAQKDENETSSFCHFSIRMDLAVDPTAICWQVGSAATHRHSQPGMRLGTALTINFIKLIKHIFYQYFLKN